LSEVVYVDTSALAKWYLSEARSDDVEAYLSERGPVAISSLTVVEMRCVFARKKRQRDIGETTEKALIEAFDEDVRKGLLLSHPLDDGAVRATVSLFAFLAALPVRTLDVLHLAVAREIEATRLATADRVMAAAAKKLGLPVDRFD
jgi:predicted nucleic acid-binding protein